MVSTVPLSPPSANARAAPTTPAAVERPLADLARAGLTAREKRLPPVLFYDAEGSRLFDEITRQPEYYPTETERAILRERADDILDAATRGHGPLALAELGAGTSDKTRVLIEALLTRQRAAHYAPIDVSREALDIGRARLAREHPRLDVRPVAASNLPGLRSLGWNGSPPRLVLFLGSSIGNFDLVDAVHLLTSVRRTLRPMDSFLLGTDLAKPEPVLHAAYNDAAGVTARFNLNVLARLNRELGADFDLDAFAHRAFYNAAERRIEMHLESLRAQTVRVPGAGLAVSFKEGETIHTENSYKYTTAMVRGMARAAGFTLERTWTDDRRWFGVHLLRRARA